MLAPPCTEQPNGGVPLHTQNIVSLEQRDAEGENNDGAQVWGR